MNNTPLHLLTTQYGFDIQSIDHPDNYVGLFTQLTRLSDLNQQYGTDDADSRVSVAVKITAAHEELIKFCDTNRIPMSKKWRNLERLVREQQLQYDETREDRSNVVDSVLSFLDANVSEDLRKLIFILRSGLQLHSWYEYWNFQNLIQNFSELESNFNEIRELASIFCENAAKLKVRADYVNKLLKQFHAKVDKKEKQILLEEIRQELWDSHEKVFFKTKQAYDKLELKLRIELESIIKKKGIGKVIGWVSSIGVVVAVVGAIIFARKARREHGRIFNGKFVRDPVKLFGYGAIVSGFVGYKAYQFENKQIDFEEILLEQMDQLKDIERNFGIICKELTNFQDKSNELAENCQT